MESFEDKKNKEEDIKIEEKVNELKEVAEQIEEKETTKQEEIKEEINNEEPDKEQPKEETISEKNNIEESQETKTSHKKGLEISIILSIIIIILLILATGFALLNINNNAIMSGIKINGIDVKALSKQQALDKLTEELNNRLEQQILFKANGFESSITLSQIETKYDIEKAVEEAYKVGRDSNIFVNNFEILKALLLKTNIEVETSYNEELLNQIVSDANSKIPDALIETAYYIEEKKLIITKGTEGNTIDTETLKQEILKRIELNSFETIELNIIKQQPKEIDIDQIYNEVCIEPKDAYYTTEPFEIFPHINGIKFDLEKAKEILKENKSEYEISLIITKPKITTSEIGTEAFPNLLSSFTTKYDESNRGRTTNLKLATEKINGTVLLPGEVFSYNKVVGERTIAKGYKEAAGYVAGKVSPTLGGGICQISSTLYDAVVLANLEIIKRRNHMFLTSYTTAGRDATVVYGAIDFQFKNTRKYPIMIKGSVQNGVAKMEIYGVKEDVEYEILIETTILNYIPFSVIYEDDATLEEGKTKVVQGGMNGCKCITYKILKLNGIEQSRTVLSTDIYDAMNKIIKKGVTAVQSNPEPIVETSVEPVVEPVVEPTPAPISTNPEPQENTTSPEPSIGNNTSGGQAIIIPPQEPVNNATIPVVTVP